MNILKVKHLPALGKLLAGVFVAALSSSYSTAQQQEGFEAQIDVNAARIDNVFRTSDKTSDSLLNVAPKLYFNELYEKYSLKAEYQGNYNRFSDNSDLDYTDHSVLLGASINHSARFSSEVLFSFKDEVELPGFNNAQTGPLTEFNSTTVGRFLLGGAYGTQQSMGQVVIRYEANRYRYDNNDQDFRDVDSDKFSSTFFYRLTSKTRLLFEASTADLEYLNTETIDLSSTQNIYLAGVEWETSGKTSSVLKVGYQDIDYASDGIEDISGLSYILDLYWQPSSRTQIRLGASRITRETAIINEGGYLSDKIEASLDHDFTGLTSISLTLANTEEDFSGETQREDSFREMRAKLTYQPKYWLDVFASYELTDRESNQQIFEFDAAIVRLGAVVKF